MRKLWFFLLWELLWVRVWIRIWSLFSSAPLHYQCTMRRGSVTLMECFDILTWTVICNELVKSWYHRGLLAGGRGGVSSSLWFQQSFIIKGFLLSPVPVLTLENISQYIRELNLIIVKGEARLTQRRQLLDPTWLVSVPLSATPEPPNRERK